MSSLFIDSSNSSSNNPRIENLSLGPSTFKNNTSVYTNNITRLIQERSGCHGRMRRTVQMYDNNSGKPIQGQASLFLTTLRPLKQWVEERSVTISATESKYCDLPGNTKSTISISYRCDGKTFASSHGDHTIKVIDSESLRTLHILIGHPRTPWTVKYHPTDTNIIASGCLAGQVRIWDVKREASIYLVHFETAIISMSFHPTLNLLALVAANKCHLWNYHTDRKHDIIKIENPGRSSVYRAVLFAKDGNRLILGETNGSVADFLPQTSAHGDNLTAIKLTLHRFNPTIPQTLEPSAWGQAISQERAIVGTALLYNCGGIDISPCGTKLIACFVDCSKGNASDNNGIFLGGSSSNSGSDNTNNNNSNNKRSLPSGTFNNGKNKNNNESSTGNSDKGGVVMTAMIASKNKNTKSPPNNANNNSSSSNNTSKVITPPFLRRVRRRTSATPYKLAIFSLENHNFGQILKSRQLSKSLALGVTSTKFSPTAAFAILGFGARVSQRRSTLEPSVANIYRLADMNLVAEVKSNEDDLNIALFHPLCGYGFIYGTRHGRIRRIQIGNNENNNNREEMKVRSRD